MTSGRTLQTKPRVLFISHDASLYGAPRSLAALLEEYTRHTPWECRIIVRAKPWNLKPEFEKYGETLTFYPERNPEGSRLFPILRRTWMGRKRAREIRKNWSGWRPDLIYSNTAMNGDILRALRIEAPVLVHVRELEWFLDTLDPLRLKAFRGLPARYFAVSEAVRRNLAEHHSIDASKVDIVPSTIRPALVVEKAGEIAAPALRKRLGLEEGTVTVGAVGRIDRRKGCDLFMETAAVLLQRLNQRDKAAFMWIGDGPEKKILTERFRELGLGDRLILTGMQENPYPYMNCLDILFTPSRADPFPRVNIEAAALGKPVVAFLEGGGSAEFIGKDCGLVVPGFNVEEAAAGLVRLIEDPGLREEYGRTARDKVFKEYDVRIVARKARELIAAHFNI